MICCYGTFCLCAAGYRLFLYQFINGPISRDKGKSAKPKGPPPNTMKFTAGIPMF